MTTPESKAAKLLGRKGGLKGGLSKSEAKVEASRQNGKKGGAPKKYCPCGLRLANHPPNGGDIYCQWEEKRRKNPYPLNLDTPWTLRTTVETLSDDDGKGVPKRELPTK